MVQAGTHVLPSVFDAVPQDLGGVYARQGFAYQDDVAAGFYVQMMSAHNLIEVSCETHDDIVLVWQRDTEKVIEFVQVKAEHLNQLWTIAKLCERTKSSKSPDGVGTSILEKSLARDQYFEPSWFSIVTCRQIHSDLQVLTRERSHEHRATSYAPFNDLAGSVGSHLDGVTSKKGNDTRYWLTNAYWKVIAENDIIRLNQDTLASTLHSLGLPYDPDTVRSLYDNLRALAKKVAELGVDNWKQKRVSRDQLIAKLRNWITPYPDKRKTERLEQKLTDAGLDEICRNVAKDQQQFYLLKKRTPGYLMTEQVEGIEQQVLDKLHTLRSSLDSGNIKANGIEFHDRCLNEVKGLSDSGPGFALPPGYLPGCMYEITARCRHRFTRFQS